MDQAKTNRYSAKLLEEFRIIVLKKMESTRDVLKSLAEAIGVPTSEVSGTIKMYEDGSDTSEQENICTLANRQITLLKQLEQALERINNGTYGVCLVSGELIEEIRLRQVPHTEYSFDAKHGGASYKSNNKRR